MKILFLAANPQSTSRLKLDTELREIEEALKMSKQSNEFELIQKWDVRPRDFRRALLEYEPDIVHFSGHGQDKTGLVIIDPSGAEKLVPSEALAGLFAEFSNIKCVLLNACYSEVQAQAIVKQVDYVVGMQDTIYDKAAIAFSIGFYDGLGYGRNIEKAFKLGKNAILWEYGADLGKTRSRKLIPVDFENVETQEKLPEHLKPILLKKVFKVTQDITLYINENENIQNASTYPTYKNSIQQYRDRVKEYLVDRKLTPIEQFQLAILAKQLGISESEANNILQAELRKIEDFNPSQPNIATITIKKFSFEVITVDDSGEENTRITKEVEFFSEDLGNGVALEMVRIPSGSFLMGTSQDEDFKTMRDGFAIYIDEISEKPQHQVKVQSFWMGKYQITQKQWRAVAKFPKVSCELNLDPSKFKGNNRPVEKVSWIEAVEFCARLSRYTDREYRLSTEAEWEYACRAGTTTLFYFGSKLTPKLARCKANFGEHFLSVVGVGDKTIEVGQFFPNSFGLYDMHGNVLEWCEDDWHSNYNGAPENGTAWLSGSSNRKVARGGSWSAPALDCRSAYRGIDFLPDYWLYDTGLRVVCANQSFD